MANISQAPSFAFVTMGCAKNEVDSEHMAQKLLQAGFAVIDDPEIADAVIVNTCSFIQAATEESIDAILEVAGFESVASGASKLIVAGCMPSRYGDDLAAEIPEACSFVPCADESNIVSLAYELFGNPEDYENGSEEYCESDATETGEMDEINPRVSAYVKISDGCDRFCSYCTIPYIRGRYHSYPEEDIVAEIARLANDGVREITLIAQDTGRWGQDFDQKSSLAELVSHVAEKFDSLWFRVMYIQPEGITPELVEAVARHDNVCNYFDIPFQHIDEDILHAMNRKGSREEYDALIASIRERIPDVAIRTTLIVGYPGESEEAFESLCDFVEEADLDYVGIFPYSREEGTRADKQSGHLEEEVKLERFQILRDLADDVCTARIQSRIDDVCKILVCGEEEDGQLFGRTMFQAPDVDGITFVTDGTIGEIVDAVIIDSFFYDLEARI